MNHNRDIWPADQRPIVNALWSEGQGGILYTANTGWEFERFERNGEMAPIPYLRATKDGLTVEAPLARWGQVTFAEQVSA